jgi:RNA polymerase sigma factor (sigma-70 family)
MPSPFATSIDELQLQRLKRFDSDAQASVYQHYQKAAYTLALRMLSQPAAALDALQDSFVDAFTHAKDCRDAARFGFWLRSIVVNRCLKELRHQQQDLNEASFDWPAESSRSLSNMHQALDLERALQNLKPKARAVLWLYYVEGYQHQEIAEMFGLSTSFSKSQLARATDMVRHFLEPTQCLTNR